MMASKAARWGIKIEQRLIDAINNRNRDALGQRIIESIESSLGLKFESCLAQKASSRLKADIIIMCDNRRLLISVKEFDVKADYNHVERDYVDSYAKRWDMPTDVYVALKMFVGEVDKQKKPSSIDNLIKEAKSLNMTPGELTKTRRIYLDQMDPQARNTLINFFKTNKERILKEIFTGSENINFFVIVKRENDMVSYYLLTTEDMLNIYGEGDVALSDGNLRIGKVILQRKGGNHRTKSGWTDKAASQLQFKIRPSECIKNRKPLWEERLQNP